MKSMTDNWASLDQAGTDPVLLAAKESLADKAWGWPRWGADGSAIILLEEEAGASLGQESTEVVRSFQNAVI